MNNQSSAPCKYCGSKTENLDQYGEHACQGCIEFFMVHPTPPVAPPEGSVLIPLAGETIKALKK